MPNTATLTINYARVLSGVWYHGTEDGHDLRSAYHRVSELLMMNPGDLVAEVRRADGSCLAVYDTQKGGWSK